MTATIPQPADLDTLSARERQILGLVAAGWSNTAIRREIWITNKTLENHMRNIYMKLNLPPSEANAHRRVCAVLAWLAAA